MCLTVIDVFIGALEQSGQSVRLVGEEGQRHCAVQRHTAAWRDGPAVAPAKGAVHQLTSLPAHRLRVHVHVLVHASAYNQVIRTHN